MTAKYLDDHEIPYVQQKQFETCRNKRPLPFDFYLIELNTCIEYDGIQHFQEVWLGEKHLKATTKHDKIKNEWCQSNGVRLIRIRYDEVVDEVLDRELGIRV